MIKKTITYEDYNGTERVEDFYFNLSKAELTEMELSTEGGYASMLNKIINSKSLPDLMAEAKKLILKAYGEKSTDGRRFVKSEELSLAFSQTEAYSQLFTQFISDADMASKFVNGVMPAELQKNIEEIMSKEASEPNSDLSLA